MRHFLFGFIFVGIAASAVAQMLWQPSAESDALFAAGVDLYNEGKYREAIPLFAKSDSLDKAQIDPTSNRRAYSLWWLSSCYYNLGDTATAISIYDKYRLVPVDRRLTVKSDSLSQIGMEYFNQGDYAKAVEYLTQCSEIEKSVLGENHFFYGNSLSYLAMLNVAIGDYNKAILFGNEALAIIGNTFGKKHSYYVMSLSALESYYSLLGNYAEAIRLGTEKLLIQEKMLGIIHPDYASTLNGLASYNYYLGNYKEAMRLGIEALWIRGEVLGKEHPDYASSLGNLANYYNSLGSYEEALHLGIEALQIQGKVLGKEHPDYATSLSNLANYNSSFGRLYVWGRKHCRYKRKCLARNTPIMQRLWVIWQIIILH